METILTLLFAAFGFGLIAFTVWREKRPRKSLDVSLIPSTPVMFAGIIFIILAIVHLMTIYGIELPKRGMR